MFYKITNWYSSKVRKDVRLKICPTLEETKKSGQQNAMYDLGLDSGSEKGH